MQVSFRNHQLERRYAESGQAIRAWGPQVGRRYVQRLKALRLAPDRSDIQASRALDLHPLTGNRRGQHAIRLTGQWRLIVTFESNTSVTVEEVVDYHG